MSGRGNDVGSVSASWASCSGDGQPLEAQCLGTDVAAGELRFP